METSRGLLRTRPTRSHETRRTDPVAPWLLFSKIFLQFVDFLPYPRSVVALWRRGLSGWVCTGEEASLFSSGQLVSSEAEMAFFQAGGVSGACESWFLCMSIFAETHFPPQVSSEHARVWLSETPVHAVPKTSQNWPGWIGESLSFFKKKICTVFYFPESNDSLVLLLPSQRQRTRGSFPTLRPFILTTTLWGR